MASHKHRTPQFKLRVKRSKAGFGLFADAEIPKNRFVIEYWGDVVSDEVAEQVSGRYLFDLGNGKNVLGGDRRNVARYINHACRPNCEVRQVGNRLNIFTLKPIRPGQELTYNYGKEYFEGFIKPNCRCATCERKREKIGVE